MDQNQKVIVIIMLLLLVCCISSSAGLAYYMMGDDDDEPPLVCGRGYLKSGTECKKLFTNNEDWIEHLDTEPGNPGDGYKKDYHYEPGTYYEGGQVFNENTLFTDFPNSTHSDEYREKHCFDKCTNDITCDMVTFARGTPRPGGTNVNVECWGRDGRAKRVFRTDDGKFTENNDLMDSDYHHTYHKKSSTTMEQ
jgi:hypothetical protein